MADDWGAFNPQPAPAGPDAWAAFSPQSADKPVEPEASPWAGANDALPEAFVARWKDGQALTRIAKAATVAAKDAIGGTPTGFSDETLSRLIDLGVFHDPARGPGGPIQTIYESTMMPAAQAWQGVGNMIAAGLHGLGGGLSQLVRETAGPQGVEIPWLVGLHPGRMERETVAAGEWAMMQPGMAFTRMRSSEIGPVTQTIGAVPKADDFANAAVSVTGKAAPAARVTENLVQSWQTEGLHPAEVADAAQSDAFLRHDIATAKAEPLKLDPADAEILGIKPGALGADITTEPPLIPPSVQPLAPVGSLGSRARAAVEQLQGLAKNIQYLVDPMATGSNRAMVVAKDAINSVRRIRWDHARLDADIEKRFTPEQREFMWIAADEESVLRQTGEAPVDTGLMTLGPEERAAVEQMHDRAQSAWLRAVDAGMVEGEGLPAYTPRMVLNVANLSDAVGPRALNELGRNVFTRTAQMLHRKHLTAEETEAAAKALVADRMAKAGASAEEIQAATAKVQIAKDIRALPLATAKLEEAATWREMINRVEDAGKASGTPTVAVGYKPDNSWFTIAGNPAFTKWEPMLIKDDAGKWSVRLDEAGRPIFEPKPIYMPGEFRGPMMAILDSGPGKAIPGAMSAYQGMMAIKGKAMTAILNSPLIHNQVVWGKVAEAAGGREWMGFGLYFRGNRIVNGATGRAQELIERGLNPMGPRGSIQDITGMMEEPTLQPGRSLTSKILAFFPGLYDEGAELAVKRAIDNAGDFWHNTLLWDRVRDVQFGLADHLSDHIVAKGVDRLTADRIATHFSNIIVGSIPREAMSQGAAAIANMGLFSRSFTLGNLATFKQAAVGLPKPILAQIERDFFDFQKDPTTGTWAAPPSSLEKVRGIATSLARKKALATIAFSAAISYVGTALFQHATNIIVRDATVDDELKGYARRYQSLMRDASEDPWELHRAIARLAPTYDNEPRKQERVYLGDQADGTATYMRLPAGKFGEEMVGWPTMPMQMLRQKLSPMAGFLLDIVENDDGTGRKIYDEKAPGLRGDAVTAFAVAKHLVMKHLPENQIMAGIDLLRGDGDQGVNTARVVGPALGFTVSPGAPGGMARGEVLEVKAEQQARFNLAWPDIRKQIRRGDEEGARGAMMDIGIGMRDQASLIRAAKNPNSTLKGRTLQNFMRQATPEQRDRFDRARGQ